MINNEVKFINADDTNTATTSSLIYDKAATMDGTAYSKYISNLIIDAYALQSKVIPTQPVSYKLPLRDISKIDFYQGKTTVVTFKDGKKVSSTTRDGDIFDKETGVIMCLIKYIYGNSIFTSIRNKIKECEDYKKAQEEDKKKLKEAEKKNRAFLKKENDYRKKVQNAPLKLLEEIKELKKQIEELKNNK